MPSPSMIMVTSDEFWISERKRSSLSRTATSASSFCSMVAPAMRTMKNRTNTPMMVRAVAWAEVSRDGSHPCQMATPPTPMAKKLHRATGPQHQDPAPAMSARATKA